MGLDILWNLNKCYCFIALLISIWEVWSFVGELSPPKVPMASRLGLEQVNDEGALEIANEIRD